MHSKTESLLGGSKNIWTPIAFHSITQLFYDSFCTIESATVYNPWIGRIIFVPRTVAVNSSGFFFHISRELLCASSPNFTNSSELGQIILPLGDLMPRQPNLMQYLYALSLFSYTHQLMCQDESLWFHRNSFEFLQIREGFFFIRRFDVIQLGVNGHSFSISFIKFDF